MTLPLQITHARLFLVNNVNMAIFLTNIWVYSLWCSFVGDDTPENLFPMIISSLVSYLQIYTHRCAVLELYNTKPLRKVKVPLTVLAPADNNLPENWLYFHINKIEYHRNTYLKTINILRLSVPATNQLFSREISQEIMRMQNILWLFWSLVPSVPFLTLIPSRSWFQPNTKSICHLYVYSVECNQKIRSKSKDTSK